MKRSLLRLAIALVVGYLLLMLALFAAQTTMIYYPSRVAENTMLELAKSSGVEPWRDAAGSIIGWRSPNPGAAHKVIVFHGNAGHALHRTHFIEALQALDGGRIWEVFVFEYPGYGARSGSPSETTIVASAGAAVQALAKADARPLFVLGESLGSGSACAMARDFPEQIAGVGLVVPFGSLLEVASYHYPFIPVKLVLRDRFDNVAALENYRGPVAFVIAGADEVVTAASGLRLHAQYGGPKHLRSFPGLRHNDVDYFPAAPWWREMSDFLTSTSKGQ